MDDKRGVFAVKLERPPNLRIKKGTYYIEEDLRIVLRMVKNQSDMINDCIRMMIHEHYEYFETHLKDPDVAPDLDKLMKCNQVVQERVDMHKKRKLAFKKAKEEYKRLIELEENQKHILKD